MITNKQILCQLSPDMKSGFFSADSKPEDFLFFDIETTGLSPKSSRVFLIGFLSFSGISSRPEMTQLLAENSDNAEERAILEAFASALKGKKHLVHFNGAAFDVPYLTHRYSAHDMRTPFENIPETDLYRELFKMPGFFRQMENHRQKSFENLVQYHRKDLLSGKEMIKIYQNYEKTKDSDQLHLLFLHNSNDLEGMLSILPLGNLKQLLHDDFQIISAEEITEQSYEGALERKLLFELNISHPVPVQLSAMTQYCYVTIAKSKVKIKMPLYEGTLKYFYPDYRNYYYLPYEDTAVHKSVGIYIDSSRRQKAKASNCYKKVSGTFLPSFNCSSLPLLLEEYNGKETYVSWPFEDSSERILASYLRSALKTAVTKK